MQKNLQDLYQEDLFHWVEDLSCHFLGIRISKIEKNLFPLEDAPHSRKKPVLWEETPELPGFSEKEKASFNEFPTRKRQMEWLSARFAVKILVKKVLAPAFPMKDIAVEKGEKGAPYLPAFPEYAISISHSGDWAICGLSTKKGRKIGLDVEMMEKKDRDAFSRIAWSEREADLLSEASDGEIVRHWTRKEAVLKVLGEGFHLPLKRLEILPSGVYLAGKLCSDLAFRTFAIEKDYCLSLAHNRTVLFC